MSPILEPSILYSCIVVTASRCQPATKFAPQSYDLPWGQEVAEILRNKENIKTMLSIIFRTEALYKGLLSCNEDDAQKALDASQLLLDTHMFMDRRGLITAMKRLSAKTKLYPRRFLLHGPTPRLEDEAVAWGTFADIYEVDFHGERTCFKVIRVHEQSLIERMAKVYASEAVVWGQLSHPNILPFYGICIFRSRISFISPWAENGNLVKYLACNPDVNRILICLDTAAGIEYLHENDIVHGDLKAVNVLVDNSGRASLGDFGLSSVDDPEILSWASQSSAASKGGTVRWQAPELHEPDEDDSHATYNSKASDIFAWAGICYEVFTGRLPYYESYRDSSVVMRIIRGHTPKRPEATDPAWLKRGLVEPIWNLLMDCWKFEPSGRPDITTVISRLNIHKVTDSRPPGEWERRGSTRFRNAQDPKLCEKLLRSLSDLDGILSKIIKQA